MQVLLVVGPTRSGKTSSLVVPNLLRWEGAAVVTSTKWELVGITAGHRQSIGPVHVYDPTGEGGDRSASVTWPARERASPPAALIEVHSHPGDPSDDIDFVRKVVDFGAAS